MLMKKRTTSAREAMHSPYFYTSTREDTTQGCGGWRRLAGFCSIHRALYPRDLATVSATRLGACACLCVVCAGWCAGRGRGALAASL